MFPKFPTSITGYGDTIEIPQIAQDDQADYEGELVVVIGKDAKNVSQANAWDYIVGYAVGNDVSARYVIPFHDFVLQLGV
jgi:2-keto-4-pentenoate hydratase/2-oxohepta-3-ene-1,7-dioic acid hydratase in catechol pathway